MRGGLKVIQLIPQASDKSFIEHSDYIPEPDLYDCLYSLNESYYKTLFNYVQESFALDSGKKIFKRIINWMIPEAKKFENQTIKLNMEIDEQLRTILRYLEKVKITDSTSQTFITQSYLIQEDIKINFPSLPIDMATLLNKIDQIQLSIHDSKLYKRMNTKLYFVGQLPLWFTKYRTVESMATYLNDNSPTFIYEGFYTVKELAPKLKEYRILGNKHYSHLAAQIQQEKRKLDILTDKISMTKTKLIKENKKDKTKIEEIFNMYETSIELVYMQLSVYHRAIMILYAKTLSQVGDTVASLYIGLDDFKLKKAIMADNINLVKDI